MQHAYISEYASSSYPQGVTSPPNTFIGAEEAPDLLFLHQGEAQA